MIIKYDKRNVVLYKIDNDSMYIILELVNESSKRR